MKSFNAYGQTAKELGGSVPVWLGTVTPIPVGAVLEKSATNWGYFTGMLIPAGTPCRYNEANGSFTPCTPDEAGEANAYLYNDVCLESENDEATGAMVQFHAEGLLIDTAYGYDISTLRSNIPGVLLRPFGENAGAPS